MNRIFIIVWVITVFCYLTLACVEPFDLKFKVNSTILSIDGTIDDLDTDHFINIKSGVPTSNGAASFVKETLAKVSVLENQIKEYLCSETSVGQYKLPKTFKGKIGNSYQLKIKLKNGVSYESDNEKMKSTPDIITGKSVFDKNALDNTFRFKEGHLIYIDTKDNPEKGDNLFWKYRVFEKQSVCQTCEGGIFQVTPLPAGRCVGVPALQNPFLVTYDYNCNGSCWDIYNSPTINVMSDAFSTGTDIKNRLIAKVPFRQSNGFLIEITQQNIDAKLFQYLKLLIEQNQTNGSLTDSPPGALIGNIKNLNNPAELVGGYFVVGNVKTLKIWVPRTEIVPQRYLNGGPASPEPGTAPGRPPLAPCIKSFTRTPIKPEGWPL